MPVYSSLLKSELEAEYQKELQHYENCKKQNLDLNMARGKPSKQQLDHVSDILKMVTEIDDCFVDGVDVRNYGELAGIRCAREYWAEILGCKPEQTFVGSVSSLNLMFDVISRAYTHGLKNSVQPWCKERKIKFLCPSPGYDRHFRIAEFFGFKLIPIGMTWDGPNMDQVEQYVKDPQVKGIWCVPKYSNPDGIIYSEETLRRFANLKPAAPDFAIIWDNAYCVHEFRGDYKPFPDIISMCEAAGNPDMVYEFASTSKMTFAGSGISVMASSKANIDHFTHLFSMQMISNDKVNQLRHIKFLKNKEHTLEIMAGHAKILAPKFRVVSEALHRMILPCGFANWNEPRGGYFVSLNTMPGTAKRALALCKEAGVEMTPAGATYPYGIDPRDANIRIAPSYPPVEELEKAMDVFCTCLKLAALEKLMSQC